MTWYQKPPLGTPLDWGNPINKGPVLHLAMNEGHGDKVQDLSMYGNHGAMKNFSFPSTVDSGWNPGHAGVGLNFDGTDDYIDCGDGGSLNFGVGSFSIMFFIKSNQRKITRIFEKQNVGYYNMWTTDTNGKIRYVVYDGSNVGAVWSTSEPLDGDWHHITCVRDTCIGKVYIYIDGVFSDSSVDNSANLNTSGKNLAIGKSIVSAFDTFSGTIDGFRIYNRPLSPEEIKRYYINPWQVYLDD